MNEKFLLLFANTFYEQKKATDLLLITFLYFFVYSIDIILKVKIVPHIVFLFILKPK